MSLISFYSKRIFSLYIGFLVFKIFFSSSVKIFSLFLASVICAEKSMLIESTVPWMVMCHFSLATIEIPLYCWCQEIWTMCLCMAFFKFIPLGVCWVSRSVNLCISSNLENVCHYFFKYFSVPFSFSSSSENVRHFYFCYSEPWGYIHFFISVQHFKYFFFYFFRIEISIDLSSGSLTPSSVNSNWCKSTQWIFIPNIAFFSSRISIWFILCFYWQYFYSLWVHFFVLHWVWL